METWDIWFIIFSFMVFGSCSVFPIVVTFSRSKNKITWIFLNNSAGCCVVISVKIKRFIADFV